MDVFLFGQHLGKFTLLELLFLALPMYLGNYAGSLGLFACVLVRTFGSSHVSPVGVFALSASGNRVAEAFAVWRKLREASPDEMGSTNGVNIQKQFTITVSPFCFWDDKVHATWPPC